MFNLETLVKGKLNEGYPYINRNGECCAFGLGYAASHKVNYRAANTIFGIIPIGRDAVSNIDAHEWRNDLKCNNPKIYRIFADAEAMLIGHYYGYAPNARVTKKSPEFVKEWLIKQLTAVNATETKTEDKQECLI